MPSDCPATALALGGGGGGGGGGDQRYGASSRTTAQLLHIRRIHIAGRCASIERRTQLQAACTAPRLQQLSSAFTGFHRRYQLIAARLIGWAFRRREAIKTAWPLWSGATQTWLTNNALLITTVCYADSGHCQTCHNSELGSRTSFQRITGIVIWFCKVKIQHQHCII